MTLSSHSGPSALGAATGEAAHQPIARRRLILAACMAASFMAAVEATIMATAMPSIAASLGGFDLYAWAFSAYMLGQAATIPIYGRLADIHGRRRVFFAGAGLFLVGSLLCGLSQTMVQLVIFRAIQGLGAGGVQPIANTIVGDIYSPVERARVQGLLSGVFGVSAIIGPSLGAFIVQYGEWPLVFWMNLPIGLVAIAMIAAFLPERAPTRPRHVDYQGSLLLLVAVAALMLLAMQGTTLDRTTLLLVAAILVLSAGALALHERRVAEPMLPLELWRSRVIASSGIGSLTTGLLMMGVTAYLPACVQGQMGYGPETSAIVLALMSVVWVLGSTTAGLWLPRSSYRGVATAGGLLLIAGAAMLVVMTPASGPAWAAIGAVLIGLGMGFCNTTYMISSQTAVAWHQRGAATSSVMFLRFLGQALGAALFAAVVNASLARTPGGADALGRLMDPADRAALPGGELVRLVDAAAGAMGHAYLLTGGLAVLALVVALSYPAGLGPAGQALRR
ncbi:MAG: MDR family MFS transporter [Acetobacteraceae bacterium]